MERTALCFSTYSHFSFKNNSLSERQTGASKMPLRKKEKKKEKTKKGVFLETSTKCKHTKYVPSNRCSCVYDSCVPVPAFMIQITPVIPWHSKINGNKPWEDIYIEILIQEEIKTAFTESKV